MTLSHAFCAGLEDFANNTVTVTFEVDETRGSGLFSILLAVPITDDAINEATEVFAIQMELVGNVDPSMITLVSPAVALCTIVDDDCKYYNNSVCLH